MKTFKQFIEQVRELPVNKMASKVNKLSSEFDSELSTGSFTKASKLVDRVGKIKKSILRPAD